MMSIDLSKPYSPHLQAPLKAPKRATPCAGLFGWRKEDVSAARDGEDKRAPDRDHPAG